MAESIIGLSKNELIHLRAPWRRTEDAELATLSWMHWWKTKRLLEPIGTSHPSSSKSSGLPHNRLARLTTTTPSPAPSPNRRASSKPGAVHLNTATGVCAVQTRPAPITVEAGDRIASMRAATEGIAGPVPAVIDAIGSDDEVFVGPAEEVDEIHWRRSRVVLIGDAAHALSPALSQGANLAMEDAYVLADEMASTDDIDVALDGFVARREPRVAFVRDKAAERIALLNSGANQRDVLAALQLVEARLSAPI